MRCFCFAEWFKTISTNSIESNRISLGISHANPGRIIEALSLRRRGFARWIELKIENERMHTYFMQYFYQWILQLAHKTHQISYISVLFFPRKKIIEIAKNRNTHLVHSMGCIFLINKTEECSTILIAAQFSCSTVSSIPSQAIEYWCNSLIFPVYGTVRLCANG